jgi:hypothetical protein
MVLVLIVSSFIEAVLAGWLSFEWLKVEELFGCQ